jgi:hypothetical protein
MSNVDSESQNDSQSQNDDFYTSKREQFINAETERQALSEEFKLHVQQQAAADSAQMGLEWWTKREKGLLADNISNQLYQRDATEIQTGYRSRQPITLTPELDEKIKLVAGRLTEKMLADIAEYTERLPDLNYQFVKDRVLFNVHPGNYKYTEQELYELHQSYADNINTDLLTDEIDAINA